MPSNVHIHISFLIIISIVYNSYSAYFLHIWKTQITWIWLDKYRQQKFPQHPQLRLLNWTTGQGATYVTTHVWPLWQCGPFVRLLPWSRCKEDPPGSKTRRKLHVSYDMTYNDICGCKLAMRPLRHLIMHCRGHRSSWPENVFVRRSCEVVSCSLTQNYSGV